MLTMMGELERINGAQSTELNHMKKDTNRELALVGERHSAILSDVKATLSAYKLSIENDRDRFEERMMSLLDRATGNWTNLLVSLQAEIHLTTVPFSLWHNQQMLKNYWQNLWFMNYCIRRQWNSHHGVIVHNSQHSRCITEKFLSRYHTCKWPAFVYNIPWDQGTNI